MQTRLEEAEPRILLGPPHELGRVNGRGRLGGRVGRVRGRGKREAVAVRPAPRTNWRDGRVHRHRVPTVALGVALGTRRSHDVDLRVQRLRALLLPSVCACGLGNGV